MKFDRLIALLEQDLNLTGTEIAEILWLAAQRRNSASTQPPTPASTHEPTPAESPIVDSTVSSTPSSTTVPESSLPTIPSRNQPAVGVYAKTASRHDSLEIALPDVAAIPHPLKLARAFRPLMQRISSRETTILDEVATVESTAELNGIVSPVLKPFQELRFDLELVIDQSDSMIFWRQTTQELEQLCQHYGIFRHVRTWGMVTDEQGEIRLNKGIGKYALSHRLYRPQILIDPSGHRLILVVSDCVGERWRNGKAVSILDTWGNQNVVAIVQMLPTRMWWRTGLSGGIMVQLDSRCQAAVANRNLAITELVFGEDFEGEQGVKVPVFSLEPDLAQTWSEMVVGKGTVGATGFVFPPTSQRRGNPTDDKAQPSQQAGLSYHPETSDLTPQPPSQPPSFPPARGEDRGGFAFLARKGENSKNGENSENSENSKPLSSQERGLERGFPERYYDFRLSSSPMARELASLLAAAPVVNLPIVRLIRRTLLRELQPVHVAEVFLGGILHPQGLITPETNPDEIQYRFIGDASTDESETIRSLFLKDSPTAKSVQIVTVISRYFAQRLGKNLKQFYGLLKQPDALKQVQRETLKEFEPEHFAEITTHILKQLGGAYVRLAEEIEAGWQGESVEATPRVTQQQSQSSSAGFPSLDTRELELFSFETVFVNRKGEISRRETRTARYFREQLARTEEEDITLDMVAIPGGSFLMGSPAGEGSDDEHPQHEVTVPSFFMSKTPITQAQWRIIASRTDLKVNRDLDPDPAYFKDDPDPQTLPNYRSSDTVPTRWDRPVERVSWYDAVEFCARLSQLTGREYRLPSEAEWEYACRAVLPDSSLMSESSQNPTYSPFHFSETLTDQLANYRASSTYADETKGQYRQQTTPVGSFSSNAFGLYDMHGNVWEWCLDDWHENYEGAPTDGSAWLDRKNYQQETSKVNANEKSRGSGDFTLQNTDENNAQSYKVLRGGSWLYNPYNCRVADRLSNYPDDLSIISGFRVVCVSGRTL
ncbi:MAG: formylglycine-generating enzyme family protein [Coleofasciculus sp. D1-CHI-01]|uniref:SAV_2336 N-terminal domain-related protein n=1 Tax=Coleofasciculus sp. D1-CHI-01 TaxID=3068482 RepID=UPI0032F2E181